MKKKLTVNDFQSVREGNSYATDAFYARIADRLYHLFAPYEAAFEAKTLELIALKLAWYMEDIVADMGLWRSFSDLYQKKWDFPVPLFHAKEEYYADEPSLNAVSYLVWDAMDEAKPDKVPHASYQSLQDIAYLAYSYLNNIFEQCPINDDRRNFICGLIERASDGFNEARELLKWINHSDYMVYSQLFYDDYDNALKLFHKELGSSKSMGEYFAETSLLFNYRCGPLALHPNEWASALAHVLGYGDVERTLQGVEPLSMTTYHFDYKGGEWVHLVSIDDKEIDVSVAELNMLPKELLDFDTIFAQFVRFCGEWRLNGILIPQKMGDKYEEYKKGHSHAAPEGSVYMSAARFIEKAGGRRVLYFKDYTEMVDFLIDHGLATPQLAQQIPNKGNYPVVFFNDRHGRGAMNTSFSTAQIIKAPDNPYYSAKKAKEDAITILWNNNVNAELVDHLIDKGYLPDAANDILFQHGITPDQLRGDMHFIVLTERRNKIP